MAGSDPEAVGTTPPEVAGAADPAPAAAGAAEAEGDSFAADGAGAAAFSSCSWAAIWERGTVALRGLF